MRNVTGRPRYEPLRKANFLASVEDNGSGLYAIGHGNVSPEQCPLYVSISPLCRFYVFPREQIEQICTENRGCLPSASRHLSRRLDLPEIYEISIFSRVCLLILARFHEFRGNIHDDFSINNLLLSFFLFSEL